MKRWGFLDTLIVFLAALACSLVALGLADTPRQPIVTAPPAELPSGTLRDAELTVAADAAPGKPLAGVSIVAFWRHGGEFFWAGKRRTGADGTAHFEELPRGALWLIAEKEGYRRTSTELVLSEEPREARVRLGAAEQLAVRVVDESGAGIDAATVLVEDSDPLPHGGLSDALGDVRFDRLGPPPWRVRVSAQGFATERREVSEDTTFTLRRLGVLSVHVVAPDGAPAVGATVVISGARLWPARKTTTSAAGIATITGLLDGAYDLRAYRGNQVSQTLFGFTLAEGRHDEVTLMLGAGRTIRVSVLDGEAPDAAPVADADVVLVEGGLGSFPFRGRTDKSGEVALGPLPAGPAAVAARAPGFVARSGVPVPADADSVRVGLVRGGTLSGTVVDADGYPIVGASIEVIGSDVFGLPVAESPLLMNFNRAHFAWGLAGPVALVPAGELGVMPGPVPPIPGATSFALPEGTGLLEGTSDAVDPWITRGNGDFSAYPVTPGRIRALVRHPDFVETLSDEVTLAPGGRVSVRIELFRGGSLQGHVKDHRDFPVAGASVELRALKGTYERFATTAHDGSFAFAAVPKQVVVSVARPDEPGRTLLREHLEVTEGKRTEMVLSLPEPRESVAIVVLGAQGEPVAMAQVTVACLDPSVPRRETVFTDDHGLVTLTDLGGLPVELNVEALGFAPRRLQVGPAPAEVRVALEHGVLVSGRITAVRGRVPVASAQVTLIASGQRHLALSDEQGGFTFKHVPLGAARVSIEHAEYASVSVPIQVVDTGRPDRPLELEVIDLQAPGTASGLVIDSSGAPVAGARVAVGFVPAYLPAGALPAGVVTTDSAGKFLLDGLAPGNVELGAYQDAGRGSVTVNVESGRETRDIVLRLDQRAEPAAPSAHGNLAITLGEQGSSAQRSVVIVSVAAGSEAERGGLLPGDRLVSVDGEAAPDMLEARSLLAGAVGSHVVLDVARAGKRMVLTIAREQVRR